MTDSRCRIDVHLAPDWLRSALRADVAEGLTASPKELPPKWFYDERGSELFDEITRLPEYYPTRCERAILTERAPEIAALSGADTLVELGSGTSEKTRLLLDACVAGGGRGRLRRFIPFDVSEATLRQAATAVAGEYPTVDVHAVCGDFDHHLGTIPRGGRRLVAFLGGTIGNLDPKQRAEFLAALSANLAPGDGLLLGTDLVKDPARLVAAYDDAAGVTAAFNRNVLAVVNRELDADFDVDRFGHVARWDDGGRNGSRCGCGPMSPRTSPSPSSASSSSSPTARRCAPRSAPSSAGTASTPSWPPPGWTSPGGGPTPPATSASPCPFGSEAGFSGVATRRE